MKQDFYGNFRVNLNVTWFFVFFSGLHDWIMLILVWFERSLHSAQVSGQNRPLALRGHVTNASFKQLVGIFPMPKIDRAHKNYLTAEIWEEFTFKGDILWHFGFSTKQYDLYWLPCWRTYFCPPTWRPKLFFAYFFLNVWYRGGSRIFFRRRCTRLLLYLNTNKPRSFFFRIPRHEYQSCEPSVSWFVVYRMCNDETVTRSN